ncbi:MAG: class I SAM-dependent methyltransferase [Planctomycetaceae bacterium]|nr:class I SAM-dependent methyltransferase [Planctomycetaceae bacterium]
MPHGDLEFYGCPECGFLWNKAFKQVSYNSNYVNNQSHSSYFARYLEETIHSLIEDENLRGKHIVEVGCGQGDFLRLLAARSGESITGTGFDPTYKGQCEVRSEDGNKVILRFYPQSASPTKLVTKADAVISRHVIEHIQYPTKFIVDLSSLLDHNGKLFIETPCAEWIVRNHVSWDFFYEHCSVFSVNALVRLVESSGFTVDAVEHRFGGQYLWLSARRVTSVKTSIDRFAADEREWKTRTDSVISTLTQKGNIALWGAGAKGVTFANEFDSEGVRFVAVVDVNPDKQGKFVPSSGHRIVAPEALKQLNISSIILLNPNYHDEIRHQLASLDLSCELIDLSLDLPSSL